MRWFLRISKGGPFQAYASSPKDHEQVSAVLPFQHPDLAIHSLQRTPQVTVETPTRPRPSAEFPDERNGDKLLSSPPPPLCRISADIKSGMSGGPACRPQQHQPQQLEQERQVTRLKNCQATKFRSLCHMHLSFLLDLDGAHLEDFLSDDAAAAGSDARAKKTNFPHFGRKKSKGDRQEMMVPQLTHEMVDNIECLIRFLSRPENLALEGVFRKLGQLTRQRALRDKLLCGESLETELATGIYSGHDVANLLKNFLGELSEPLLTEKHFSIYCKIPDMVHDSLSECDRQLLEERQMATVQLLVQLLPRVNALLLKALLDLLHKVATTEGNLMTSRALGTLFAPHLLVPRRMSASELHQVTTNVTKVVAFLVENAPDVFKVPTALMSDITAYWQEMEEATDKHVPKEDEVDTVPCHHRYKKHLDSDALHTTVTFVDRQALQRASVQTDTQTELAQLYAHISSMPESAKKRKLLKQFNRANGVGTPMSSIGKHKRSKSLTDSIKKMVGRSNHKRRGSGHGAQVCASETRASHALCPSTTQQSQTVIPTEDSMGATVIEHTPVIKGRGTPLTDSYPASPVLAYPAVRLFKENEQQILPSSPCVHIVDLKAQPPLLRRTRKRKLGSSPGLRSPHHLVVAQRTTTPQSTTRRRLVVSGENENAPAPGVRRWTKASKDGSVGSSKCSSQRISTTSVSSSRSVSSNKSSSSSSSSKSRASKSPHAHVVVTPDRRFARASSYVSPITRSMTKAPRHIQTNLLTPGSRRPMSVIQSP